MKKLFSLIASAALMLCIAAAALIPSFAADGDISDINIHVDLDREGNAYITEIWTVEVPDNWTEMYLVKGNLGEIEIEDLGVTDLETGKNYTYVGDDWDVDLSRSEKANKCGTFVDEDNAVEICWGVGSSGEHRYQVTYTMTNLVQTYEDDCDGFNVRFVNEGMSSQPENVTLTISAYDFDLVEDETLFWAFGLEGQSSIENGDIVLQSTDGGYIQYVNVLVQFTESKFEPNVEAGMTFEELRAIALDGSDYQTDSSGSADSTSDDSAVAVRSIVLFTLMVFGVAVIIVGTAKHLDNTGINLSGITREEKKNVNYCRNIPFGGDLATTYGALDLMGEDDGEGSVMAAYILKWIQQGYITVDTCDSKGISVLSSGKKKYCLKFTKDYNPDSIGIEGRLWLILRDASGKDGILQEKEFKKWSSNHYQRIESFYNSVKAHGNSYIRSNLCENTEKKVLFMKVKDTVLTDEGRRTFLEVLGFRKYLKDFTIINEREAKEVSLWNDYLVFAALFGIADEVAEQFKNLLPDFFENPQAYGASGSYGGGFNYVDFYIWTSLARDFSHASHDGYKSGISAAEMQSASSGHGGFTSFGGGGGFSGGGVGGGGR